MAQNVIIGGATYSAVPSIKVPKADGTGNADFYLEEGTLSITTNGTHSVSTYASVSVDVDPTLEAKTLTLGSAAPSSVTPSTGYDGIASVAVALDSSVIKAANIASGVQMLGITGTHSGGSASYTDNASGGMTCEITI